MQINEIILTKNRITFSYLLSLIILNVLTLFDISLFNIRSIYSACFILFIPGLLCVSILKLYNIKYIDKLILSLGFSIILVTSLGLLLNTYKNLISTNTPLTLVPLLTSINIIIVLLISIVHRLSRSNVTVLDISNIFRIKKFLNLLPLIIPFLTVLGANLLNNDGSNIPLLITISTAAFLIIVSVVIKQQLFSYPVLIYSLGLSLLFMISMRSQYIFGSDIYGEYTMFSYTNNNSIWNPYTFPNSLYNLCLSITIFPTILAKFTGIDSIIVFKMLMPMIIAFIPVVIYAYVNIFQSRIFSFFSAIFFLSFPSFYSDLSTHLRQGISLFFFALFMYVHANYDIKGFKKYLLIILFGTSVILSHYSTAFITLITITTVFLLIIFFILINIIFNLLKIKYFEVFTLPVKTLLPNLYIIFFFWVIFFGWYSQTSGIKNNSFILQIAKIAENVNQTINDEFKADRASVTQQLNINYRANPQKILNDSFIDVSKKIGNPQQERFDNERFQDYKITLISSPINAPLVNYNISVLVIKFGELIKRFGLLFMIIGVIVLTVFHKYSKKLSPVIILAVAINILLIISSIYIPFVSLSYNIGRVYQQAMVLLSFAALSGAYFILNKVRDGFKILIISLYICLHFIVFTGLLYQVIGGTAPVTQFSNKGYDYQPYYLRDVELESIRWLSKNKDIHRVYTDSLNHGKIHYVNNQIPLLYVGLLIPQWMTKSDYVYLGYLNTTQSVSMAWLKSLTIAYSTPSDFLNYNKSLIYSNGGSKIYK